MGFGWGLELLGMRKRRKWMEDGALGVWNKNYYITVSFE